MIPECRRARSFEACCQWELRNYVKYATNCIFTVQKSVYVSVIILIRTLEEQVNGPLPKRGVSKPGYSEKPHRDNQYIGLHYCPRSYPIRIHRPVPVYHISS